MVQLNYSEFIVKQCALRTKQKPNRATKQKILLIIISGLRLGVTTPHFQNFETNKTKLHEHLSEFSFLYMLAKQ